MLSMLDRHAVQELVRAGVPLGAIARRLGVSRRTIRRIKREVPITSPAAAAKRPGWKIL
jgi:IS30 family transposase